ncbi:uncharacterized protein LOC107405411 [Ziziphus jujuba]|nr:uncharacterized protein LOC107405411 [Ziziphus jujuba]
MDSRETSWADQWDYSDPQPVTNSKTNSHGGGNTAKYKQKVGDGLVKTKAVASNGVKKVKDGASVGFQWIKQKYHNTTHKN